MHLRPVSKQSRTNGNVYSVERPLQRDGQKPFSELGQMRQIWEHEINIKMDLITVKCGTLVTAYSTASVCSNVLSTTTRALLCRPRHHDKHHKRNARDK